MIKDLRSSRLHSPSGQHQLKPPSWLREDQTPPWNRKGGGDIQPPPRGGTHRVPGCLPATGSDARTPAKPYHPPICPSSLPPETTTTSICLRPWLVSNRQPAPATARPSSSQAPDAQKQRASYLRSKTSHACKAPSSSDLFFSYSHAILFSRGPQEWFFSCQHSTTPCWSSMLPL